MKYVPLGRSDLQVSEACLGTMTWGEQNTEHEAHEQIEYALAHGVNFIDTAEMYAVPPRAETCGLTEQYIGNWLASNSARRKEIILATKIAGAGVSWIRDGQPLSGASVQQAVDDSLRRLQTDYIDLYQLHWPNRPAPQFGKHWPGMLAWGTLDAASQREQLVDILQGLDACVKAGKIRYCGLSNETPWGIKEYLSLAEQHDLPRMVSVQNEFNLLHLLDTPHLIETCVLDEVAYLPWSPIAGGALSGKYRNGAKPAGCRWTMVQRNGIFRDTTHTHAAIEAYYALAQRHGLNLTQMCLAWVYQFNGVSSTIIGATTVDHLKENIDAHQVTLSDELLGEIDQVIKAFPVPF